MVSMSTGRTRFAVATLLLALAFVLNACAPSQLRVDDGTVQAKVEQRAKLEQSGAFRVYASVPSDEEALRLFGLPLSERGIQAVWFRVVNDSDHRARFVPYSVDPEYFPPNEVAYMFRKKYSRDTLQDIESLLLKASMPRVVPPRSTRSGYVFTHENPGTKAFNVDIYYPNGVAPSEQFTFFVDVPGFTPDHASVDFNSLYEADEIHDYSLEEFRAVLADWPCCTVNQDGSRAGRPWSVIFVAPGEELLRALLRAEWYETSLSKDPKYLSNIDYLYGRPPDARFKKLREEGSNRNEMLIWLAPVRVDGMPVWVAQVNHAISRFFGLGNYFFGARVDPDMNEGRNYLLQDLWYSQALEAFAFSATGADVSPEAPRLDFNGKPWFIEPYRLVLWVSGEPVSLKDARDEKWDPVVVTREDEK